MKRNMIVLLMILMIGAVVTAGGRPEQSAPSADDQQPVVLQYWMWDPNFAEQERAFLDEFERRNPRIRVEMTALPTGEYWTRMTAMAAAGQMPDLIANHPTNNADLAEQGVLMDLSPWLAQMDQDEYYWDVLETSFRVGDGLYGVPFAWVGTILYYNQDMFNELGIPLPHPDWTWDDFLSAARTLTRDTNGDGITDIFGYNIFSRYAVADGWIANNAGDFLDRTTMQWNPNEGARETIQFFYDLVHVHGVSPRPRDRDLNTNKNRVDFVEGRVGMITEGSWSIYNLTEVTPAPFAWDIAYIPRGPRARNQQHLMQAWADGLSIPASSRHPEEAWQLLRFLVEERPVEEFFPGKVPFIRSEASAPGFDTWTANRTPPESKSLILDYGENAIHFYTKQYSVWRGYGAGQEQVGFGDVMDRAFNGEITMDQLWTMGEREVSRVLREAYR